ncbi:peroxisomal 2 4-dienoyl-CoA reductase sps19 [Mucor circinelloides]
MTNHFFFYDFVGIAPGPIASTVGMEKLGPAFDLTAVPMQRMGEVQDIAHATVFLFSEAATYISGVVLVVDGGAWLNPAYPAYPNIVLEPPQFNKL